MRWSMRIATVGGTTVRLHLTLILFLLWIAGTDLWAGGSVALLLGLPFIILIFASVLLHELAHIWTARRFGARTADVTLLPIGGVSRIDPMPEQPLHECAVALAGPAMSLLLGLSLILLGGGLNMPTPAHPEVEINFMASLGLANIFLGVFNLLPAFPLDGGRVLMSVIARRRSPKEATRIAAWTGQIFAILIAFVGLAAGNPLLVLAGLFVFIAGGAESGAAQIREAVSGMAAADLMITHERTLQSGETLGVAAEALIRTGQHEFPVLDETAQLVGVLTRDNIVTALHQAGDQGVVSRAMIAPVPTVQASTRATEALCLLEEGARAVGVENVNGQFAGLITFEILAEMTLLKKARTRSRHDRAILPQLA